MASFTEPPHGSCASGAALSAAEFPSGAIRTEGTAAVTRAGGTSIAGFGSEGLTPGMLSAFAPVHAARAITSASVFISRYTP